VDLVVIVRVRAWADQRHRAVEYVEELRQLVEAGAPQKAAEPRHAWVIARRLLRPPFDHLAVPHGPELVDLEDAIDEAIAILPEQHRPRAVELDGKGNQHH